MLGVHKEARSLKTYGVPLPSNLRAGFKAGSEKARTVEKKRRAGIIAPAQLLLILWCGQEDLNLHSVSRTSTSSWRVCQFRHGRNGYKKGYIGVPICLLLNDFKEHALPVAR